MSDFDTRRVGEIAVLEDKIRALQEQVSQYRAAADKWTPVASSEINQEGGKISLRFGGKIVTATVSSNYLAQTDLTSATTAVTETLCSSLVIDRLKEVVQPEVDRMIKAASSLSKVGNW